MRYALRMPEEQIDSSVSTSVVSARLSGTGLSPQWTIESATSIELSEFPEALTPELT